MSTRKLYLRHLYQHQQLVKFQHSSFCKENMIFPSFGPQKWKSLNKVLFLKIYRNWKTVYSHIWNILHDIEQGCYWKNKYIERHFHLVSVSSSTICYPFGGPFGKCGSHNSSTVSIDFIITQKTKSCKC